MAALWVERQEARERRLAEAAVARALEGYSEVDLRPVLRGEALAGRARDAYARAMSDVIALGFEPGFVRNVHHGILSEKAEDQRAVQECLKRAEAALAHLADGARCSDAGRLLRWDRDAKAGVPSLLAFRELVNLTALKMAERHRAGDDAGLIASFLDGLQISGDFLRSPRLIEELFGITGVSILCGVFAFGEDRSGEGAPYVIDATKLSRQTKGHLAQGLRRFLAGLPRTTRAIEPEAVSFWQEFSAQNEKAAEESFWPQWDAKAGLISREGLIARSVREALDLGAAFRAQAADPEVDELLLVRELQRERSPINCRTLSALSVDWEVFCKTRQGALLQLWLLTAALEFESETESQTLSLPYGLNATVQRDGIDGLQIAISHGEGPVPDHLQMAHANFLR